jgi:hypothetical protein
MESYDVGGVGAYYRGVDATNFTMGWSSLMAYDSAAGTYSNGYVRIVAWL